MSLSSTTPAAAVVRGELSQYDFEHTWRRGPSRMLCANMFDCGLDQLCDSHVAGNFRCVAEEEWLQAFFQGEGADRNALASRTL
jgi:hypothetical protein